MCITAITETPGISHAAHGAIREGGLAVREALAITWAALAMLRLEAHDVAVAVRGRMLVR